MKLADIPKDKRAENSFLRLTLIMQAVIAHNQGCSLTDDKICLTRSLFSKLSGCYRPLIDRFIEANKSQIDEHNSVHLLTPDDNRKGYGYDFQATLAI